MNSPLDWDYEDLKRRMEAINKPPYTSASGTAGNHCPHCPKPIDEHCVKSCRLAYVQRYGVQPP